MFLGALFILNPSPSSGQCIVVEQDGVGSVRSRNPVAFTESGSSGLAKQTNKLEDKLDDLEAAHTQVDPCSPASHPGLVWTLSSLLNV